MTARDDWDAETARLYRLEVVDALHHALVEMAGRVFAEYEGEIARLRAALDELRGTYSTQFCMDRDLDMVISSSTDATEGDRIRATDTGREFVLRDGGWFEERPWKPATAVGMDDPPLALTPSDGMVNRYRDQGR